MNIPKNLEGIKVHENGNLEKQHPFISWFNCVDEVNLNGYFKLEDLEWIVDHMKKHRRET